MSQHVVEKSIMQIPAIDYRCHPAYGGIFQKPSLSMRYRALRKVLPYLVKFGQHAVALRVSQMRHRMKHSLGNTELSARLGMLARDGIISFRVLPQDIDMMNAIVRPYVEMIDQKKTEIPLDERRFKDKIMFLPEEKIPELYQIVSRVLDQCSISLLASAYRGLPAQLGQIALQVNDPSDPDWQNHFSDVQVADPPTTYMHIDGTFYGVKCLLYLTDVGPANGPFSYVAGSNRLNMGMWERLVRTVNDKTRLDRCDRANRELFFALPRMLQKKAEFGNDLNENGKEIRALLASEHAYHSQEANLVLFDARGIHRGGMVREGKRHILQIMLAK